jgi:hypothetical protein
MAVHEATWLLGEKATVLSELLPENVSGLRKKLRKKEEKRTKSTRVQMSSSWFVRKAGEENAGIHRVPTFSICSPKSNS